MEPLASWTIGPVEPDGFDCLKRSIESFTRLYDVDVAICFNCENERIRKEGLGDFGTLIDQNDHLDSVPVPPKGVSWKLYPPRLSQNRREIVIDNDLVIEHRIPEIDKFLQTDCALLLEETSRTYGRFERHVPPGYMINSGLYGLPANFHLEKFVSFHCGEGWEENARHEHKANRTFDEQGLVALALLNYHNFVIVPHSIITNCEHHLVHGSGYHFIGLNRRKYHRPYRVYKWGKQKTFL